MRPEALDVDPGTRAAINQAWRLGICTCGTGAPVCPACDGYPPTCGHPQCQPRPARSNR